MYDETKFDPKEFAEYILRQYGNRLKPLVEDLEWYLGSDEVGFRGLEEDQRTTNFNNAIVNEILSADLQLPKPFVLYFPSDDAGTPEEYYRAEYNDIRTLYDLLGAIDTYYREEDPRSVALLLQEGHQIRLSDITRHRDGYKVFFVPTK